MENLKKKRTGKFYADRQSSTQRKQRRRSRNGLEELGELIWNDFHLDINEVILQSSKNPKPFKLLVMDDNEKCLHSAIEVVLKKDKTNLTDRGYQIGLSENFINGPSKRQIKLAEGLINNILDLQKNANGLGFYFDPRDKIEFIVKEIVNRLNSKPDTRLKPESSIPLKLCADGINITFSHLKILILTFTCLLEKDIAKTSAGNYLIGNLIFYEYKN